MQSHIMPDRVDREVRIPARDVDLQGELKIPQGATGIVIFAHGSGSSRHSSRNQHVAHILRDSALGTLLFDLLTPEEEIAEQHTRHLRFDIGLLAERLSLASAWLRDEEADNVGIGFFGASTGGGAALVAAAELGDAVGAVVSRGGRPDLAGEALARVSAPTLLIVGERDAAVIELNREAFKQLRCEKELRLVPRATHLFEEPGTLDQVARLAADWFKRHLQTQK